MTMNNVSVIEHVEKKRLSIRPHMKLNTYPDPNPTTALEACNNQHPKVRMMDLMHSKTRTRMNQMVRVGVKAKWLSPFLKLLTLGGHNHPGRVVAGYS
jgi:hypothetical protein